MKHALQRPAQSVSAFTQVCGKAFFEQHVIENYYNRATDESFFVVQYLESHDRVMGFRMMGEANSGKMTIVDMTQLESDGYVRNPGWHSMPVSEFARAYFHLLAHGQGCEKYE